MTLQQAQRRLLAHVRDRIQNGEWTERGFARLIGISQPHAHNVLKGVRKLSPTVLDAVLKYINLSLIDLATLQELEANLHKRKALGSVVELPFLVSPIGPGLPWPAGVSRHRRFSITWPSATSQDLVAARLAPDPSMHATLAEFEIAILDTSERALRDISPDALYVVERNREAVLRYIRPGASRYYLVSDLVKNRPTFWEKIRPAELAGILKAKVLHLKKLDDAAG